MMGLMKNELGGKIMAVFVWSRPRTYSYFTYDGGGNKSLKGKKNCIIKQRL